MPTTFVNTKMYWAHLRPNLVARPRLIEKLDRGLEECHSLTLVSAPAGYGKTTLLHEWLSTKDQRSPSEDESRRQNDETQSSAESLHPFKIAWLTVDEADNDPTRFWSYVVLSLQAISDELGETVLAQLRSPQPPPVNLILPSLLNEIDALRGRGILVLDDYHAIHDPRIHESMGFVLEHLPSTLHLVLSTRTDPPLPLARLRANALVTEVRAADLRFTLEEVLALLNDRNHLGLSDRHVITIAEQTEGWIAGLQLAALSLEGRDAESRAQLVANFSGRQQFVLDYLTDEVLRRQSESVQTFLLQTSILDRLIGALCDAVTERSDGHVVLESLNKANLFLVPLDTEGSWYRYHHLFAELLRARLRESRPDEVSGLHTRASEWCEQNGLTAEAVDHAMAARDLERAGRLVKQVAGRMFVGNEIGTLLGWLRALSGDTAHSDPELSMILAWALLATSQMDVLDSHLAIIERELGVTADGSPEHGVLSPRIRGALAEILCVRSNLPLHSRDPLRVLRMCERGFEYLGQDVARGLFQPRTSIESILTFNCAVAHELLGDLRAAEEELEAAIAIEPKNWHISQMTSTRLAQLLMAQGRLKEAADVWRDALRRAMDARGQISPFSGLPHAGLGNILCEWNQLDEAESQLKQGLELGRPWSNLDTLFLAHAGLARIQESKGDYEAALGSWEELRQAARNLKASWAITRAEAHRACLWARQGNFTAARRWVERMSISGQETIPSLEEVQALILARVLIALGELDQALGILSTIRQSAEAGGRRDRCIEILMLQALVAQAQGRTAAALSDLRASLALAEPDGYVRVYLDEGEPMGRLLKQVAARDPANTYIANLLSEHERTQGAKVSSEALASPIRLDLPDQLTRRELEVLHLLAQGLTNREIAEKLYLSPNTLRVYTYSIYRKLDVHNRTQAVAKARQLGILSLS